LDLNPGYPVHPCFNSFMQVFEYTRRHLRKEELAARYDEVVKEMNEAGWELAKLVPTYGYVRTFWEQEGRGPFQGSYLVFRRRKSSEN
jgi:hypothetical protein